MKDKNQPLKTTTMMMIITMTTRTMMMINISIIGPTHTAQKGDPEEDEDFEGLQPVDQSFLSGAV